MEISTFSLAVTIVGAYIGAGFVSGQELWQFFGTFGLHGLIGFALAITLICFLSGTTLWYVSKTGKNTFDKVISIGNSRLYTTFTNIFQFVFYLGVYIIMCAGVQSLIAQYTDFSKLFIGFIFCITVTIITLIGAKGITAFFSAVIPILVLSTIVIAVLTFTSNAVHLPQTEQYNTLLSNWIVSSFVFVSYNFFAGIGVFALVGKYVKSTKVLVKSTVLSFTFLLAIGFSIILSVSVGNTQVFDMPMLQTAYEISPVLSCVYAILLLLSMLGAGISSLVPFVEWFKEYFPNKKYITPLSSAFISIVTVFLSIFGFSNLIGTVYPIFGYIGFFITIIVIRNIIVTKIR